MDSEKLQRLLADRDGGLLSDEVIALLEAHAKVSPAVRSEIDAYAATMQGARDALEPSPPIALPAFPRDAVSAALRTSSPRSSIPFRNRSRIMGLAAAACVVFAFVAGRLSNIPGRPQGETQVVASIEPVSRSTLGIWSIDARRRAPRPEADSSSRLIKWNSPLAWPVDRRS